MQDGIERDVLSLEGVDHLMRQHQAELRRVGVGDREQGGGIGIVITGDLLGVEVYEKGTKLKRVRQQPEQPVRRLQAAHLGRRQLLVELANQIGPHLLPGPDGHPGTALEGEPGGALDRWAQTVHHVLEQIGPRSRRGRAPAGQERRGQDDESCHPHQSEGAKRGGRIPDSHAPVRYRPYQAKIAGPAS